MTPLLFPFAALQEWLSASLGVNSLPDNRRRQNGSLALPSSESQKQAVYPLTPPAGPKRSRSFHSARLQDQDEYAASCALSQQ